MFDGWVHMCMFVHKSYVYICCWSHTHVPSPTDSHGVSPRAVGNSHDSSNADSYFGLLSEVGCLTSQFVYLRQEGVPYPWDQVDEVFGGNAAAAGIQLSKQDLHELEDAVPGSQAQGSRNDEAICMMGGTYAHYQLAKAHQ